MTNPLHFHCFKCNRYKSFHIRRRFLNGTRVCTTCYTKRGKETGPRKVINNKRIHQTFFKLPLECSGNHNPEKGGQVRKRVYPNETQDTLYPQTALTDTHSSHPDDFSEPPQLQQQSQQLHPETTLTETSSQNPDWLSTLRHLTRTWHRAELVLIHHFPAHENLLASSRGASGNEPTEPDFNRMVAAAECWKKSPNLQTYIVSIKRVLIEAMFDVERTVAALGELIIPSTQGGTLVGKGGILHILTALGIALNCADHERGDTECVRLSEVEKAVKDFETERYLADNWERNESLMETTRCVKDRLDRARSDVLFSSIVAGCRTQCTDYRQTKWVVVKAITESNILVTGDTTSTSLILAIRRSRFGSRALPSSSGIQCRVIIDLPIGSSDEITTLIPWMHVTDTGQILCGSRIGGWYIKWSQSLMYRGFLWPRFLGVSQEEVAAVVTSDRTLIRRYHTYIRTRTSLSVDVVCRIGWFVLNAPIILQNLYKDVANGSNIPDSKLLGTLVIDRLRMWGLYEGIGEQGVTERSVSHIVINTDSVENWVKNVIKRCLRSIGGAGVVLISSEKSTLHCTSGGSPMVDGQKKLPGSGFFSQSELQNHTTRLTTTQGILEAVAPESSPEEKLHLLRGIHAVCDQLCSNLLTTPDFSALKDLGDFSYRRNVSLQLVPGAYSSHRGRLDEEEAIELRKNWPWLALLFTRH